MALHTTDFSEHASGVQPSGWTKRYTLTNITITVEDSDLAVAPGKMLVITNTASAKKLFSWDVLDGTSDLEALMLVKVSDFDTNSYGFRFKCRASGAAGSEKFYSLNNITTTNGAPDMRLGHTISGAGTTGTGSTAYGRGTHNDQYIWIRFSMIGTACKWKIWRFDHLEPYDWTFEGTKDIFSDAGWCGLGVQDATTVKCYWLGVDTAGTTVPFPSTVWNQDVYFGIPEIDMNYLSGSGTSLNATYMQGGWFNEDDRYISAITIRFATRDAGKQARLAVYAGNSATDPAAATLVVDFGATVGAGTGYETITLAEPVLLPAGKYIWLTIKSNNASGLTMYYYDVHPTSDNTQKARGRGNTTGLDENPAVAFPATFGYTPTFQNYWYALRLTLVQRSLFPPPPEEVRQNREDISGNARHLLDTGTDATGNTIGKIGNACYFSGAGEELLTLASAPDLDTADPNFTLGLKVKPHADEAPGSDIYWEWSIGAEFIVRVGFRTGEVLAFCSVTSPSLSVDTGNVIPQDVWSHLCIYFDGSNLKIDLNNSNLDTAAGASLGLTGAPASMSLGFDAAKAMTISIDEIGIWLGANALDAAQRTTLYSGNYGQRPSFA